MLLTTAKLINNFQEALFNEVLFPPRYCKVVSLGRNSFPTHNRLDQIRASLLDHEKVIYMLITPHLAFCVFYFY